MKMSPDIYHLKINNIFLTEYLYNMNDIFYFRDITSNLSLIVRQIFIICKKSLFFDLSTLPKVSLNL